MLCVSYKVEFPFDFDVCVCISGMMW